MSAKLTYMDRDQYTTVKLDGRMVGRILKFRNKKIGVFWAYVPKGSGRGEPFTTREDCKRSLEIQ